MDTPASQPPSSAPAAAPSKPREKPSHPPGIRPLNIRLKNIDCRGRLTVTIEFEKTTAFPGHRSRVELSDPLQRQKLALDLSAFFNGPSAPANEVEESRQEFESQLQHALDGFTTQPLKGMDLEPLALTEMTEVSWLWPGKIPRGKLTLLGGAPSIGKSMVIADLAARISTGGNWPDGAGPAPRGDVILINYEDDPADTLRPRLQRAGADLNRVLRLQPSAGLDAAGQSTGRPFLLTDLPVLRGALQRSGETRMVVIDPISAAFDDGPPAPPPLDPKQPRPFWKWEVPKPPPRPRFGTAMRRQLAALAQLAKTFDLAVILVSPLSQSGGTRGIYRSAGSMAIVNASDAAWFCAADPRDPSRRALLPAKIKLAEDQAPITFRIADGRVHWNPPPALPPASASPAAAPSLAPSLAPLSARSTAASTMAVAAPPLLPAVSPANTGDAAPDTAGDTARGVPVPNDAGPDARSQASGGNTASGNPMEADVAPGGLNFSRKSAWVSPHARLEAMNWLIELLTKSAVPAEQIRRQARAAGISRSTLSRAASSIGICRQCNSQTGIWEWRLPKNPLNPSMERSSHSGLADRNDVRRVDAI